MSTKRAWYSQGKRVIQSDNIAFVSALGEPWQELTCLVYQWRQGKVLGIYHGYARCPSEQDSISRSHVHGLSLELLNQSECEDEAALVTQVTEFMQDFEIGVVIVRSPSKYAAVFDYECIEYPIPPHPLRFGKPYHVSAKFHKDFEVPFHDVTCPHKYHSAYVSLDPQHVETVTDMYRCLQGYECTLENVHEHLCAFIIEMEYVNATGPHAIDGFTLEGTS